MSRYRIRRFLALPARERSLTLRAAALALFVDGALRVLPLTAIAKLLGVPPARRSGRVVREAVAVDVAETARSVDRALRALPDTRARCLRRALVLGHLLRAEGPELRVGVHKTATGVRAHAWLEVEGTPIAEPHPVDMFTPLSSPWLPRDMPFTG